MRKGGCKENLDTIIDIINESITKTSLSLNDTDKNLNELMDSIEFVRTIVKLEEMFNVEIPDEYLLSQNLSSIRKIEKLINSIMKQ